MAKEKLTPPDLQRCQAERPNGLNFMTLGGPIGGRVRCSNPPSVIITEKKAPGPGKAKGSMSLCDDCLAVCREMLGAESFEERRILPRDLNVAAARALPRVSFHPCPAPPRSRARKRSSPPSR